MESHDDDMEAVGGGGRSVGIPVNSRWNPTKEQISMLETLYSQGIRTPTTEQIQQITRSLKAYGHIEGKNVFYWFQNHKARQRQKQKQENMASYINTYLHKAHHQPAAVFASPPCPNVACSPYHLPQRDLEFYQKHPKLLLPGSYKRRATTGTYAFMGYEAAVHHDYNYDHIMMQRSDDRNLANFNKKRNDDNNNNNNQETLPLFPLHPTGILRGGAGATTSTEDSVNTGIEERCRSSDKPYFDFFIGQDPYDESRGSM